MKRQPVSRRQFISAAAITASGIAAMSVPSIAYSRGDKGSIRIGLIGSGSRGCGLVSLLKMMPGTEVIGCCDIIPEHLQQGLSAAGKGAKGYTDYRKLLDDKAIDAVIIATPLFLHYQMAVDALNAGKHIYLEKSLAFDIQQTLDLVKRVRQSKVIFQVGYQYRYYGLYHKVKEVINKNWLGKITHFECQYNRNSNWRNPVSDSKLERIINWRMYREFCGGPLSELCAHEIDMVNYLLASRPLKVIGMGSINYWKDGRDTYDNVRTIYEYPGGIKAAFTSVLSNAYNGYGIRILGDRATVEIQREKALIYSDSTDNAKGLVDGVSGATIQATTQGSAIELTFKKTTEETEPTTFALEDFLACIREGKRPISNVFNAAESSIAIHMGNMAMDTETVQTWKPEYSI